MMAAATSVDLPSPPLTSRSARKCLPGQPLIVQCCADMSRHATLLLRAMGPAMATVGLTRAAELTGKSASTIHRAMRKGRLSFTTDEHGTRLMDTAELDRVFGVQSLAIADDTVRDMPRTHEAPLHPDAGGLVQLRADLSVERLKSTMLEERVREMQGRVDDLRQERDEWRQQAQTLLVSHRPAAIDADASQGDVVMPELEVVSETKKPRQWWRWLLFVVV